MENYQGGDGVWDKGDMEAIWTDAKEFWLTEAGEKVGAVTRRSLSRLFGGYCNYNYWLLTRDYVINPWVDGGCVPEVPTDLRVAGGDGQLVVSWNEPAFSGGTAVTKYVVEWKQEGEDYNIQQQEVLRVGDLTDLMYVIEDVEDSIDYSVKVTALNRRFGNNLEDGWGEPAEATGRTVGADGVPGAPRNLELMAGESDALGQQLGNVVASWQALANEGHHGWSQAVWRPRSFTERDWSGAVATRRTPTPAA